MTESLTAQYNQHLAESNKKIIFWSLVILSISITMYDIYSLALAIN